MSINGDIDTRSLIEERDNWKKKYEGIESEYLNLKKKLEEYITNYENKNVEVESFTKIKTDILMKYKYMENECEYLNIRVNILTLEKEEEIKKRKEMEMIIIKKNKEIEGYKKILEKVKSMNLMFKKKRNEVENKMSSMLDNDLLIMNDNILLKELIKVNSKLNEINNKVNEKMKEELEKVTKKLHIANNKINKFHDAFINANKVYIKYKEEKEKKLSKTLKINEKLKEELEKKKAIEKYNVECRAKSEEYNAAIILLNYYEIKYKLNDLSKNAFLKYINLISDKHDTEENVNKKEIKKNILLYELYNTNDRNQNEYEEQINTLKNKILKEDDFYLINKKKSDLHTNISLLQNQGNEENSLEAFILNNLNSSNILEILYYNVKIINDILECFNITLSIIIYIYDTYLKEIIININNFSYLQSLEKSYIRFSAYFFITLSKFLLSTLKYIHFIKNADTNDYLKLIYNERIFYIFFLSKHILEQYIEKIKIKLFSSNIDYSILNLLSDKLNNLYGLLFIQNKTDTEGIEKEKKIDDCKIKNDENKSVDNDKKNDDNAIKINIENIGISHKTRKQQDKEKANEKEVQEINKEENISSFELFCFLNFIIATSILLMNDKNLLFDPFSDIDTDMQKEILIKCEEILKLIKIPKKILNFHFCIKRYKFPFENFQTWIKNYKSLIVDNINNDYKNEKTKTVTDTINQLSENILNELKIVSENISIFYTNDREMKKLFIFDICDKYVEMYNNIISKKNKNVIDKKFIEEKEAIIKKLENDITNFENKIQTLNKKINILTIKEEKCNKIQIDLDILKNEKNEYLNIINDLRKSKNESTNEITYITKHYNETKNKYNELLKAFESKKKYLNNNKNSEKFNLDIYYMKKIINNLYYENFLTKINKNYHMYDEKINYYNEIYNNYSNINFLYKDGNYSNKKEKKQDIENQDDENKENNQVKNEDNDNIKNDDETNIMLNKIFGDEIYFVNKNNKNLFDDIYDCELIKSRLGKYRKTNYSKNKLYQTVLCNSFCKQKNKYVEIIDIVDNYKRLKNEIINELLNMSINNNIEKQMKKNYEISQYLYSKLSELKNVIKHFYMKNNLKNLNKSVPTLDNILNITINEEINKEEQNNEIISSNSKNLNKKTYLLSDKVILSEQSLSYLIQNLFNL